MTQAQQIKLFCENHGICLVSLIEAYWDALVRIQEAQDQLEANPDASRQSIYRLDNQAEGLFDIIQELT